MASIATSSPKKKLSDIEQYIKKEMQNSLIMSTGFESANPNKPAYQRAAQLATARLHQSTLKSTDSLSVTLRLSELKLASDSKLDLLERKHSKINDKLTTKIPNKYYADIPIKPGFLFLDSLLKAPKSNYEKLAINIPESLYHTDKLYYLHTENGQLRCTTEINGYMFIRIIEKYKTDSESDSVMNKAAVVLRGRSDKEGDMHKILMDWNQLRVKMSGNEYSGNSILQRYIKSPGGRPSVTRLFYNAYQKGNKANFAYFITSKIVGKYMDDIQKCVVDTSKPQNIDVFTKSGVSLRPYEKEAEKIVEHLNRGYNVRIEEIVLEFLNDEHGVIWFIGCKSIRIDPSSKDYWLRGIKEWWPDIKPEDYNKEKFSPGKAIERNKALMSFIHCKLCRLYYQNNELSHLVSVRMLLLYKVHVNRRMDLVLDTSHLKVTSNTMLSQTVRVCQYCYMLITSEFELMRVEEALSKLLSVPFKETGYEDDPKLAVQLQFLPKKLTQWRILFLCTKLFEFNLLPNKFYIHLNFLGCVTTFFVNNLAVTTEGEAYIPLSMARVHYLFSNPDRPIKSFLETFLLEIRITEGERYEEKVIAESQGNVLNEFPCEMPVSNAFYCKKQLVFFSQQQDTMCNLSINIGISCDKILSSKKIKVLMNKQKEIYIPESHYMTTDPLPIEWMELLGCDFLNDTIFGVRIDEEKFYCPQMTRIEMLRMEDITSPYKKLHSASYDHIASKVLKPAQVKLPEPKFKKVKRVVKKVQSAKEVSVTGEAAPFYKVVKDFLRERVAGSEKRMRKRYDSDKSLGVSGIEAMSTHVSPLLTTRRDKL